MVIILLILQALGYLITIFVVAIIPLLCLYQIYREENSIDEERNRIAQRDLVQVNPQLQGNNELQGARSRSEVGEVPQRY